MEVSRITRLRKGGQDYIRIFGYNLDGQPVKQLKEFKNYVFVENRYIKDININVKIQDQVYKSYDYNITSTNLKKVILTSLKTFTIPKKIEEISYQSDITPETKYLLDNNLEFSRKRHIAFFDIQTFYDIENDPQGNSADNANSPITSITFYSNLLNRYFVLAWHPDKDTEDKPFIVKEIGKNKDLYLCKNEAVLLDTFCYFLKELNVDIITGWYSHGYDIPYIIKRLTKLFGNADKLSPVGNTWLGNKSVYDGYYKIKIRGLDTVDLMQVVQSLNYNLQNNALDTAAGQILGDKYKKIKVATWRDWQENFEGFIKYAIRDVEILYLIDKKLKIFEYLIQMQILSSITSLNDIMSVTKLIDSMVIKKFWNKLIFPNNKEAQRQNYKGGLTIDPTISGVHKGVAVLDYASLYPTTIMAYNISPETFLFSKKQLGQKQFQEQLQFLKDNNISYVDTGESDELFGERYIFLSHKEHIGCLPELSYDLYTMRKEYKQLAKKAPTADERLVADKKQYAIKIILNSIYGAMGFPYFRLFVPECADSITFFGRKALRFAMDKMSACGVVLYGDTDSVDSFSLIRYKIKNQNKHVLMNICTIEELYNLIQQVFITQDGRHIKKLPFIQLEYYDQKTKTIEWGDVDFIERHYVNKPMYRVILMNDEFVEITQDHSLVVLRNNKLIQTKVSRVKQNDQFITLKGITTVKDIELLPESFNWVYDIQMKDTPHTFFANGILVHNSVFIKLTVDEDTFKKYLEEFNKKMLPEELIKKYHPDINEKYFQYELEHEKDLSYLYLGDRKKRYYSIQQDGSKYIHGLNIIKKDTPAYISKLLDELCEKAVMGNFSVKDLEQAYEKIKSADLQEIAVHKSITKRFEKYNKTMPQHVAGALFANQHLGLKIRHSDVVYLFYINNFCEPDVKPSERKNVICLRKEDFPLIKTTDKFQIDYYQLFEKQILLPLRQFDKIPEVKQAIEEWSKLCKDNYKINNKGQFVFKKRKF